MELPFWMVPGTLSTQWVVKATVCAGKKAVPAAVGVRSVMDFLG